MNEIFQPPGTEPAALTEPETPAAPLAVGEQLSCTVVYSRDDIARFARDSGDANPVHHDRAAAQRAHHGDIIASGQQTAARMMGLVASHFSRQDDGMAREMLCLNFNFSFKAPVFADRPLTLSWQVQQVSLNARLAGWVAELSGEACSDDGAVCVIGRGTVLVKLQAAAPAP